ncbi:glycosyltransferase family 2 protein [Vibrio metoecus]|uniref:glycosyltransferase family 2 protein n=1 Tax=Vibrio metoecus TaxID=1481663 RepID=UPI0001B99266|nr:glycosyltransferase family 2 protein [Vibrio metoecus]EEX67080.1 glycosyl transferase family 2 [Vibrio metoecus]
MMLLSIVVPTHNRAKYAYPTVCSLFRLGEDVQIVVCDSSDNDELQDSLLQYSTNPNLCFVKTPSYFSVVDNFNEGVKHASGKYVVFIGDDDIISQEVISVAKWAENESVDAIKFTFPAQYHWPDFASTASGTTLAAKLVVKSFSGKVKRVNPKATMYEAISDFGRGVIDMPRAYSGMASLELLNKITSKYGQVFGGVSPDIYSSVLISNTAENVYLIDRPLVVPGVSGGSTSAQSVNGGHLGKLRDNNHIGQFRDLVWDSRIPEFYSVPTVWSFSMLKALEAIGYPEQSIQFPALYFKCYLRHKEYKNYIQESVFEYIEKYGKLKFIKGIALGVVKEISWFTQKLVCFLYRKILRFSKSSRADKVFADLSSTIEASVVIDQVTKSK